MPSTLLISRFPGPIFLFEGLLGFKDSAVLIDILFVKFVELSEDGKKIIGVDDSVLIHIPKNEGHY